MTNRTALILAIMVTFLASFAGAVTAHTVTDDCPSGWVKVEGPAICELEGTN